MREKGYELSMTQTVELDPVGTVVAKEYHKREVLPQVSRQKEVLADEFPPFVPHILQHVS
jgi:hypothetical protein